MDTDTLFSIRLSLQVALVATFLVFWIGGGIAYLLATKNFRGKGLVEVAITIPLILPPTVVGYYLVVLFGRHGFVGSILHALTGASIMFTWWAAVLACFVVSLPLMIKAAAAAIAAVDRTMIESSYILGYSEWQTAVRIVFPLARPGIMTGVVLSFARALGEFGATLMLAGNIPGRTSTMPLAIYTFVAAGQWQEANLLAVILTLTSALFLWWAHLLGAKRW